MREVAVRQALFRAKTRLSDPGALAHLDRLQQQSRLPRASLDALVAGRAAAIARHAAATTPWYAERYAGIDLDALEDPAAFARLPVVEKDDVRDGFDRFRSTEAQHGRIATTGGSTGEPARVLYDTRLPVKTLAWRLYSWWGVGPEDDHAIAWRALRSERSQAVRDLVHLPARRLHLDASLMSPESIRTFADRWRAHPPALFWGYSGAVLEVADFLLDHGIELPAPKAVAFTAGPLQPASRERIERAFRAPLHDTYRCGEIPWLAGECAARAGLHVFADERLIEILDADGDPAAPGETGEVVVTDLTNRAFPLVRYRLGDRAALLERGCSCGVTLPLLSPIDGRISDMVHLPDGRILDSVWFIARLAHADEPVRQYRVVQHPDASISVLVVPEGPESVVHLEQVVGRMRRDLGTVDVRLEVVDAIPHDRGKTRDVISDYVPVRPATSTGR